MLCIIIVEAYGVPPACYFATRQFEPFCLLFKTPSLHWQGFQRFSTAKH